MLTVDMLKQNTSLAKLSDEQLNAIYEMSRNDENTVIGTKIGALHGQYDNDILSITGIEKHAGEKSYDYAKRVLNDYKSQLTSTATIQAQLANAQSEVQKLKDKLAEGSGDEVIKQQLKDAKTQVSQLQGQLKTKKEEFNSEKEKLESQIKATHVDYAFQSATSSLKFKSGISESLQKILLSAAKAEVLSKGTPDFIESGNGEKKLVFRDSTGNVLNNPTNNLNPYTINELLMQTSIKDAIDTNIIQQGGGTKPLMQSGSGGTSGNGLIDFSNAKNQVDADKIIESYLLAQGITRDSEDFAEKSLQLRTDNNISQLPIR